MWSKTKFLFPSQYENEKEMTFVLLKIILGLIQKSQLMDNINNLEQNSC